MIEIALNQAVITVVGMAATGAIGFLAGILKQHTKREKARIKIEKAMARQMIFDAYEKYIINHEHMTIARYEELLETYEAYTVLGGNGTAKRYMKEIMAKKPYLVTE